MRLGYFTMPMHPLHRNWTETLDEDHEAVILADQLGFHDAFIGEHLTDKVENITNSLLFQATLIHSTKTIKLATGTTNLSQMHPVLIASHAAMFDHLAKGRFILGISPGNLRTDAEALGTFDEDRGKLFAECIDVILEIWSRNPPYEIDLPDNRFKVSTARSANLELGLGYLAQPYQQPRPEIVGTVVAPFSKGVIAMGRRDFHPLSANFLMPKWLPSHWANYQEGKAAVGAVADAADWRVARSIFVADDDRTAARYARDDRNSPYMFYFRQLMAKFFKVGRTSIFKEDQSQPDDSITLDYVADRLVWHGGVNRIVDHILALHEEIGDFGELVYAGMDWLDPTLARRSMELMATEVMPRVNRAIGEARPALRCRCQAPAAKGAKLGVTNAEIPAISGIMVVDAVGFEPVSASQYPANWEIYRETKRHRPTQLVFSAAEVIISKFLQRNSLDERTENFSVLSGDSGMSASPLIAAVGADIPISRNVPGAILARTRIGRQSCGLLAWKFAER